MTNAEKREVGFALLIVAGWLILLVLSFMS